VSEPALSHGGEAGALSPDFHVAHHFDSADTQFDAGKLGIWLFLVTEVLLFGGLFCAFAIFRTWYFAGFVEGHHHLDKIMGGINTVVLITSHKFHEHLLPGAFYKGPAVHATRHEIGLFFTVYFMMTGIHGLHVIIGMGLMTWVLVRTLKGQFSSRYYAPVEGVGLYWHLVDLVWIYLFPLLYLVG
jgi:cytochrome c oxidase subunit 3